MTRYHTVVSHILENLNFSRVLQNRLLSCIKEAFVEEMARDDLGDVFTIATPPSRSPLPPESKRPKEGESESVVMSRLPDMCLYLSSRLQPRLCPGVQFVSSIYVIDT